MEELKAKILIVDDEKEIVDTLKHFLDLRGYETRGVCNGEDALTILSEEKIDLVLLDLVMPGLSGQNMARIIRDKYPNVKIIVITAHAEEGQKLFKEKYIEGLFIKPMMIKDLCCKLKEVIEPKQFQKIDLNRKKHIRARLFLIKARLLFWEPSLEYFNQVKNYFSSLSKKGEIYEIENVTNESILESKIKEFKPDIFVINMGIFDKEYSSYCLKYSNNKENLSVKETIVYTASGKFMQDTAELERLSRAIELICLKNGLIEVKWVEI